MKGGDCHGHAEQGKGQGKGQGKEQGIEDFAKSSCIPSETEASRSFSGVLICTRKTSLAGILKTISRLFIFFQS
jgi:hypothetical protein